MRLLIFSSCLHFSPFYKVSVELKKLKDKKKKFPCYILVGHVCVTNKDFVVYCNDDDEA